ncbi:CotS family spore coat protein [Paenibacillus sp. sgz302251]|uniref:CotS family spore coat protein n=1 Tax=Paenibacillus sp. sgz302251 TaxID=3414493 RepID=UPI003C7C256A
MDAIEKLKRKVEHDYGLEIKRWQVIKKEKNISFVAQVVTSKGKKYALKSLYITPERQHFIAKSEQMLAQKGVKLALPIPTLKGDLYMIHNRAPYVLYQWIDGKSGQLRHQDDLESIIKVLARFHHASHELDYPTDVKIYSHPHWKKEYKDRIKSMERWYNAHKSSKNCKKVMLIRSHIPFFQRMAKKALKALKESRYEDYLKGAVSVKSLVHGDLHQNNLINRKDTKTLIDFEDIRYDLPSKDLLRIYSMYTNKHPFVAKTFRKMIKTYEHFNPLSPEVKQIVLIDLTFPHIFERILRKKKYVRITCSKLKHRIKQEKKKIEYIHRHYLKTSIKNRRGSIE